MTGPVVSRPGLGGGLVVLSLAAVIALVLTLALAWIMEWLISPRGIPEFLQRDAVVLDFVRVKRLEVPPTPENRPRKPPPPAKPPLPPKLPALKPQTPTVGRVPVVPVPVDIDIRLTSGGFTLGQQEGEFLPLFKVAPVYPRRARRRGIEGSCVVEYRVTTEGTTADVRVLESECTSTLFHEASRRAAFKFRYKPRVVDGQAVEVPRVRNKFIYRLEK